MWSERSLVFCYTYVCLTPHCENHSYSRIYSMWGHKKSKDMQPFFWCLPYSKYNFSYANITSFSLYHQLVCRYHYRFMGDMPSYIKPSFTPFTFFILFFFLLANLLTYNLRFVVSFILKIEFVGGLYEKVYGWIYDIHNLVVICIRNGEVNEDRLKKRASITWVGIKYIMYGGYDEWNSDSTIFISHCMPPISVHFIPKYIHNIILDYTSLNILMRLIFKICGLICSYIYVCSVGYRSFNDWLIFSKRCVIWWTECNWCFFILCQNMNLFLHIFLVQWSEAFRHFIFTATGTIHNKKNLWH